MPDYREEVRITSAESAADWDLFEIITGDIDIGYTTRGVAVFTPGVVKVRTIGGADKTLPLAPEGYFFPVQIDKIYGAGAGTTASNIVTYPKA